MEVLKNLRPSDLAARFAILRHDLPQEFPTEVTDAANRFAPDVLAADRQGREDFCFDDSWGCVHGLLLRYFARQTAGGVEVTDEPVRFTHVRPGETLLPDKFAAE